MGGNMGGQFSLNPKNPPRGAHLRRDAPRFPECEACEDAYRRAARLGHVGDIKVRAFLKELGLIKDIRAPVQGAYAARFCSPLICLFFKFGSI